MTLDELGGRLFASTTEAGAILDADPRTIRRGINDGTIPGQRMGSKYLVPVDWLRQRVEGCIPKKPAAPEIDIDQLADRVADKVFARFARVLGAPSSRSRASDEAPEAEAV